MPHSSESEKLAEKTRADLLAADCAAPTPWLDPYGSASLVFITSRTREDIYHALEQNDTSLARIATALGYGEPAALLALPEADAQCDILITVETVIRALAPQAVIILESCAAYAFDKRAQSRLMVPTAVVEDFLVALGDTRLKAHAWQAMRSVAQNLPNSH